MYMLPFRQQSVNANAYLPLENHEEDLSGDLHSPGWLSIPCGHLVSDLERGERGIYMFLIYFCIHFLSLLS